MCTILTPLSSVTTRGAPLSSCRGKVRYSDGVRDKGVAIVTSDEARERDRLAIESGTPSRTLMQNAGEAATQSIIRRYPDLVRTGVEIHTGPGNNGGDGWVVAGELARRGIPVRVLDAEPPRSADAAAAKADAQRETFVHPASPMPVVMDALLGTGSAGAPRGALSQAVQRIQNARANGSQVISLDIPSGLDATTGEMFDSVIADLTLSFGTLKRGHLLNRDACGAIEVLDIGLGEYGRAHGNDVTLISPHWVSSKVLAFPASAHKGTRRKLAIIAGDSGMAGAAILAGQAALRSGIGLLQLIVSASARDAVHIAVPAALVSTHDELLSQPSIMDTADAIVLGPGLAPDRARALMDAVSSLEVPFVLDAGALSAFAGRIDALGEFCRARDTVMTPHPAEMARLTGRSVADVLANRFEIGAEVATRTGSTVLLKGTPTVVSDSGGARMASAAGTPALATGGSGDLLSGIVGTLVAQGLAGFESAGCAAWIHGRAAELCGKSRGVTLEDILYAMPAAWNTKPPECPPGVLAFLPAVQ